LLPWEVSMTQHGGVTTSAGGDGALGRKKEETTLVRLTQILLGQKIKKIHSIHSTVTNGR
jgi:hypothetical protein